MPRIVITHAVDDTAHWLAAPTREAIFGSLGVTNIQTYTDPQNPTQVALTLDAPDLDALLAAVGSPEGGEAMKADGVLGDTVTFFVEA